ncbi:hypothetical protein BSZ39_02115 [Bowdeniella nasicola]|uniref:SatD family (SatD) n=1 Tax=Bowdeniella nasicola TaxID=208480 RepID=A0A1Q5Q4R0_9ACTO|nr:hypothetical protein [Bowdeniella nasicola]OKL54796.1 hypothetical protein BSZ39_02115 [Bowdeniella nasicola]
MFVLTADQIDSGSNPDRVPEATRALNALAPTLAFERTVGDEFQGAFDKGEAVVAALLALIEMDCWHIGVGVGEIDTPLPKHSREGDGPAFRSAREAVERAKRQRQPAIEGAPDAQAVLRLMNALLAGRTERQWEIAALAETLSGADIAAKLDIAPQTVSDVLKAGHAKEIAEARPTLARLLESA